MSNCNNDHATFRSVIDCAFETGITTRKALGCSCEADDEMVRRWLAGQWPALRKFRRLISIAAPLPLVLKRQLIDWFLRGSCFTALDAQPADRTILDANHDGIVDERDTVNHVAHAVKHLGDALECAVKPGHLSPHERATVRQLLYDVRDSIDRGVEALDAGHSPQMRAV